MALTHATGSICTQSSVSRAWSLTIHLAPHTILRFTDGTARDVSFLIDFLPAYLFPNGERMVAEWAVAGISLGGHATWYLLANGGLFQHSYD